MQRNCDDERETFMRQRFPSSGFNFRPHTVFHNPRRLIGVAILTQMVSDLTSIGQNLTFQVGLNYKWCCLGLSWGIQAIFLCVLAKSNGLTD